MDHLSSPEPARRFSDRTARSLTPPASKAAHLRSSQGLPSILPSMETAVNTAAAGRAMYRARNTVPYAAALAAVAAFAFLSGGYVLGRTTVVVLPFLIAAAVWVWFLRRRSRPSIALLGGVAAFAAFFLWSGLSVLWSLGPDLTWMTFNLTGFYLAVVAVLGFTSVRGLQVRTVAYGYLAVAAAVGIYAFLGKSLPELVIHAHQYARLDSPVGYWNVLAVMMVMGLSVALAMGSDRSSGVALRTAAAAAAVPMCYTFFFSFSRGGWVTLAVALVLYFAFTTTRLASLVTLAAVTAPVALTLWHVRGLDTLFNATTNDALRTQQGGVLLRWALIALAVTVVIQAAAALLQRLVPWPRWSRIAAGAVVLTALAVLVAAGPVRYVQTRGGVPWIQDKLHSLLSDEQAGQGNAVGRLTTLTTNGRVELWREAVQQWRHHTTAGTGAGTFVFAHYRFRSGGGVVKHAHGQWANVLAELGTVGLVLFAAALALLLAAAIGNPFSRRGDPLHPLLVALQTGAIALIVHMSADWDWDMAAITTAAMMFVACCASYQTTRRSDERLLARRRRVEGGEPARETVPSEEPAPTGVAAEAQATEPPAGAAAIDALSLETAGAGAFVVTTGTAPSGEGALDGDRPRTSRHRHRLVRWPLRVTASALLVLLGVSWLPPYLSWRSENAALAASSEGDVTTALTLARRSSTINPLAVDPLFTEASLLQQLGRNREALAKLQEASRLQPQNFAVWYELGVLLQGAFGREQAARAALTRALALNPHDADSRGELEALAD